MSSKNDYFQFPKFKSKWWAWNGHVHTIFASQFLKIRNIPAKRLEIKTPDNDFLELDVLEHSDPKGTVALFHGLEGSTERIYIRNLMSDLYETGYSSVALNFRGCGHKMNNQKRLYHSGETSDYKLVFEWIKKQFSGIPVYAVGFSLGANALIKSLGEEGSAHLSDKSVAVSPPFDLLKGSIDMHSGFNRLYEYRFIQTLTKKAELKRKQFPEIPEFKGKSMYDFDNEITGPIHGFKNAEDYYEQSSSKHFVRDVQRPLLIIHSKQDTICPLEYAPHDELAKNPFIKTLFTRRGGHVGFLSNPPNWLNRTIIHWFEQPNDL